MELGTNISIIMKIGGIYSITNTINNKIYCGSSNDCNHRWSQHKSLLIVMLVI
jgi:predicted GIY-YIG superfamily endonuclease